MVPWLALGFASSATAGEALTLPQFPAAPASEEGRGRDDSGDCRSADSVRCSGCSVRGGVHASECCVCEEGRTGGR